MQNKLNVVFTIDRNYIQHFCVTCTSLLENNPNLGRIFLVHDMECNTDIIMAINFLNQKYKCFIHQITLSDTIFDNFKISHHLTKATYFRLLLAEILPKDMDRVLFLDADIIVNGSLEEIVHSNFSKNRAISHSGKQNLPADDEYYLLAVDHKLGDNLHWMRKIGFKGLKYFNAGVMYINLQKWRSSNMSRTLIQNAIQYNEYIRWWDQDVLNITFDGEWGELDFTFNAFGLLADEGKDHKIIHYIGSSKPWHFRNKHPYKQLYWQYLKMTPFKNYTPVDLTFFNILKSLLPASWKKKIKSILQL